MKRLFLADVAIALLLLLSSCASSDVMVLIGKAEDLDGEEKHEYYMSQIREHGYKELYYNECYLLLEEGRLEEAIILAEEALSLHPDYFRMQSLLLYCYRQAEREEEYQKLLEDLYNGSMKYDEQICELLLDQYLKNGNVDEAEEVAINLLHIDTVNEKALRFLSTIYPFFSTQLEKAIEETKEDIQLDMRWNSFYRSPLDPGASSFSRSRYNAIFLDIR